MTRRAYGFYDWSKEAVLLPKPPKRVAASRTINRRNNGNVT